MGSSLRLTDYANFANSPEPNTQIMLLINIHLNVVPSLKQLIFINIIFKYQFLHKRPFRCVWNLDSDLKRNNVKCILINTLEIFKCFNIFFPFLSNQLYFNICSFARTQLRQLFTKLYRDEPHILDNS